MTPIHSRAKGILASGGGIGYRHEGISALPGEELTMRVVLAMDKFKGTLSAQQACAYLAEGIRNRNPKIEVILRPMADGGDGTAEVLSASLGMEALRFSAPDLIGKSTESSIHWHNTRRIALVESAELVGVGRCMGKPVNIQKTNTVGIGRALLKCLELRPQEIWLGVGGTMTAEAGWGIAHILGLRAFDSKGNILDPVLSNVEKVSRVELQETNPLLKKIKITALCDVNCPARGAGISLSSFLPQKGADENLVPQIEKWIFTLWSLFKSVQPNLLNLEDAFTGSGGGMVLGLQTLFPELKLDLGARAVARSNALGPALQASDLVVCGEGGLDGSTLYGKACSVVGELGRDHSVPVFGVFGKVDKHAAEFSRLMNLQKTFVLFEDAESLTLSELVKKSRNRLHEIGAQIAHEIEK